MSDALSIERASDEEAVARYVRIRSAVEPDRPVTVDDVAHSLVVDPAGVRFVAYAGRRPIGTASAGKGMSDDPQTLWASLQVLDGYRRRGVGSALLLAVSEAARARGCTELLGGISAAREEGRAFARSRGFSEVSVDKQVSLDLIGRAPPDPGTPPGVELSTLAARPDLLPQVYEVASESVVDIPTNDTPLSVPEYDDWRRQYVDRPGVPPEAFFLAIADGQVIGYANLATSAGRPGVGFHAMTGVRRAWRGRGVAGALKRTSIAWAIDAGLETLETQNNELNTPMRAVNARLGYRPLPDFILVRGPVAVA